MKKETIDICLCHVGGKVSSRAGDAGSRLTGSRGVNLLDIDGGRISTFASHFKRLGRGGCPLAAEPMRHEVLAIEGHDIWVLEAELDDESVSLGR